MAVKARDDVTLANITDVANVRRYYLLQASTLAAPAAPTANPAPSPWVTSEPSYSEGSTNSLYTVDLTVFSDGSFDYSPVSKSSSYEAAKSAWNKANAASNAAADATNTANSANQMATEGIIVVRRNLHKSPLGPGATSIPSGFTNANNSTISWNAGLLVACTAGATDSGVKFGSTATIDYTVPANRTLTVGLDVTGVTAGSWRISVQGGWVGATQNGGYTAVGVGETKRLSFTFYTTSAGTADPSLYLLRSTSTGTESARISNIVLAEGSVEFFDGDTTPDSSLTPDWEGEEQKSVSTLSRVSTAIKKSNLNSIDVSKLTEAMAGLISMSVSQPVSSVVGSMWFELDDDENLIGVYYFDGDNWQRYAFIADSVMVPSSIGPTLIQDGAIQTPHLSANSVTSKALASGSVSTENLTIGAITKAVLDDTLAGTISNAQEWADKVVLTNESITITNGLISPTSLVLRNDRLTFYVKGVAVAYIDSGAQQMSIKSAIIENALKVGKHAIEAYTSEITIIRWVG